MKKNLTIIIPSYNDILHLDRMLKSLQEAPYNEIATIFIINDNDNIEDSEYKKLMEKYNMDIKYYRNKENVGVGATRKRGIELSNTSWISFLDQDDYVTKWYFKSFIAANTSEKETKLMYSFPFMRNYRDIDSFSGFPEGEIKKEINDKMVHIGANFYNKLLFEKFNIQWLDDRMSDDLYMNTITSFLNVAFDFIKVYPRKYPYIYVWDNVNDKSITNTTHAKEIIYHLLDTYTKTKQYFATYFSVNMNDKMYEIFVDKNTGKNKLIQELDEYIEHLRIKYVKYKFPNEWEKFIDMVVIEHEKSRKHIGKILSKNYNNNFISYVATKYVIVSLYDKFNNFRLCNFVYELYNQVPKDYDIDNIEYERTLLKKLGIK